MRPGRRYASAMSSAVMTPRTPRPRETADARRAHSGHSRGFRTYPDRPQMPAPRSAPGVNRTPDLQVRSLRDLLALPCSAHRIPVATRLSALPGDVSRVQMGWAWHSSGTVGSAFVYVLMDDCVRRLRGSLWTGRPANVVDARHRSFGNRRAPSSRAASAIASLVAVPSNADVKRELRPPPRTYPMPAATPRVP